MYLRIKPKLDVLYSYIYSASFNAKGEDLPPNDIQSFCFYCSCVVAWWLDLGAKTSHQENVSKQLVEYDWHNEHTFVNRRQLRRNKGSALFKHAELMSGNCIVSQRLFVAWYPVRISAYYCDWLFLFVQSLQIPVNPVGIRDHVHFSLYDTITTCRTETASL